MSSGWLSAPLPEQGGRLSEIDTSVPHIARVYDYWLGGKDNFAPDRAAAEAAMREDPNVVEGVRGNRAFLARAVRYLAGQVGIRQFLDIGTGIPAADNTHEVAQDVAPECRVVYVDNDPIVLSHARALLTSEPGGPTAYLDQDLRNVGEIVHAAAGTAGLGRGPRQPGRRLGRRGPQELTLPGLAAQPGWLRCAHRSCCSSAWASLHASSSRSRALSSSRRVRWRRGGIAQ